MAKIFWVECPKCHYRYYASTLLQGTGRDLMCPGCKHRFPEGEGSRLYNEHIDRTHLGGRTDM